MSNCKKQLGKPVYLRSLEMDDLPRVHKWHNDPDLYASLTTPHHYVSRETVAQWLRKRTAFSTAEIALAICLTAGEEHIGNIYLKSIDWVARHARLALFIAEPTHRSKGYGEAAIRLIITHAFCDLGLARLHVTVLTDNVAAIKTYEKCGFRVEGQLRHHAFKSGQFRDLLFMGLCSGDDETA